MSNIINPDTGILYMKVGTHAQESLSEIISRKKKEIGSAGFALWGYGGNTCHPQTMVQPFAQDYASRGRTIYLCMQEMDSKHFAEPVRADEFSADGLKWEEIPEAISVRGSRYALVIRSLNEEKFELPLFKTQVALGNSTGRIGSRYISGRVDKACLRYDEDGKALIAEDRRFATISLVAELASPYAVFVRNRY